MAGAGALPLTSTRRIRFPCWVSACSLGLEPGAAAYVSTMFDIGGGVGSPLCGILADKLFRTSMRS